MRGGVMEHKKTMAMSAFAKMFGRGPKTDYERVAAHKLEESDLCHIGGGMFSASSHSLSYPASPDPSQLAQLAQFNANAAQQARSYDRVVLGQSPLESKASKAITTVVEQLPMRLAGKIARIDYVCRENTNGPPSHHHFAVRYINDKVIQFDNIDTFPLEEDIARIALECP